jgi:FKBP-type peptidyl-prolyl cis-trans isomerase FkpA
MIKHVVRFVILSIALLSIASCAQTGAPSDAAAPKLETEDQKTFYALGLFLASRNNLNDFKLTPGELAIVKAGITDSVTGAKPQVELDAYGPKLGELHQKRMAMGLPDPTETKKKGQEFADTVAKEKDATKTPTGLVIRTITPGTGGSPAATDMVKVHYEGKLIDGTVFDSSIKRGQPEEFPLNRVVPCWTQGLQMMKKGGKAQLVCPSDLAYGDGGQPPTIPPGATLTFEVELLDFKKP